MKNRHLPPVKLQQQGPDGKTLHVTGMQNMQDSAKSQALTPGPRSVSEHVGGRTIPYMKPPKK